MKVSIIIPAYNAEKYIVECLESIKQQQYPMWECIIIDDCSKDDTANLIQKFIVQNNSYDFKFEQNSQNMRQGESRNRGVNLATGTYLMFTDSDDVLPADALLKLVSAIQQNEDIVIGNYASFWDGDFTSMQVGAVSADGFYLAREENFSNIYNLVYPWGKLYRREFWQQNDFKYKNVLFEDTVLWSAVSSQAQSIKIIDDVIYYYRTGNLHSESYSIVVDFRKYYLTLDARLATLKRYCLLDSYYVSYCLADAYQYINDLPWATQRYKLFLLLKSYLRELPADKFIAPNLIPTYKVLKLKKMYRYGRWYFILKPKTNLLKLLFKKFK